MDKKEVLINTQIVFFYEKYLDNPEDHYPMINSVLGNVFDNPPLTLPLPKDQRLNEVPVVSVKSSNGVYTCNIARSKIEVFIAGEGEENFTDIKKNEIVEMAEKLYEYLKTENITIKRMGFITRFFVEDEIQDEVLEKILKKSFIDLHTANSQENVSEFIDAYIRYVRKIKFLNLMINNYTTIEKLTASISGENVKGLMITRDFNTNPDVNFNSDKDNDFTMKSFINEGANRFCLEEIKKILW